MRIVGLVGCGDVPGWLLGIGEGWSVVLIDGADGSAGCVLWISRSGVGSPDGLDE